MLEFFWDVCIKKWIKKNTFSKVTSLNTKSPWQTKTIQYRRHQTGRLEWPGGLWKFWSSSLPHPRGRALALWRLNRAWLGMSKFGYLNKKQRHFKLTMLCLFIYLLIMNMINQLPKKFKQNKCLRLSDRLNAPSPLC